MDDWLDWFMPSAIIVIVLACVLGGISTGMYYSDRAECSYAATNAGVQTKFVKNHLLSWDCYVIVDGEWIPIDKWRGDSDD